MYSKPCVISNILFYKIAFFFFFFGYAVWLEKSKFLGQESNPDRGSESDKS